MSISIISEVYHGILINYTFSFSTTKSSTFGSNTSHMSFWPLKFYFNQTIFKAPVHLAKFNDINYLWNLYLILLLESISGKLIFIIVILFRYIIVILFRSLNFDYIYDKKLIIYFNSIDDHGLRVWMYGLSHPSKIPTILINLIFYFIYVSPKEVSLSLSLTLIL